MPRSTKNSGNGCPPCQFNEPVGKSVLNSLSAHIAILDRKGVIVETNRAWQEYARGDGKTQPNYIGMNYLSVCDGASGEGAEDAHAVAAGIRKVISGRVEEFLHDYPCHTPTGKHWYYMRAIRMEDKGPLRVVVSHEEITALKIAEEALRQSKEELEERRRGLEESNIALKVLLNQREKDKLELEQNLLSNIKNLVFPFIEKLKSAPLREKDAANVRIVEERLLDIISPLLQRMTNLGVVLTPQEMQIAALVKDGRTSKEMAGILNVAETTIHFHRKNLRSKFGLKQKNANLRAYLLSMS